ncbi:type II and III secretion system protein family protein [Sphingosinicella sp. YJ22]|uniref:type II and III secretion system protein family protein n=1 Tax=Sphingosinicella sp. YJ22 TaxID=1104780 RepID=UPI00140B91F5|nr:type II and III secretion system protein family protein [Sphingosinicella sp. YJ22]
MLKVKVSRRLGLSVAAALAVTLAAPATQVAAQPTVAPAEDVTLSVGAGRLVQLNGVMADLFVANDAVADVQVRSNTSIYIFGKAAGQTTVYATDRSGRVIYSASVRVGQNLASVDEMLDLAMPEAEIRATPMSGMVLLTGTVSAPEDAEEAQRLVQAFVGEGTQVLSRLRTATPQQVMLQVRIAEVSRSLVRDINANITSRDQSGGFLFGIGRGAQGTIEPIVSDTLINPVTGNPAQVGTNFAFPAAAGTLLGAAGRLFGVDLMGSLDLNESNGLVNILAEPTLTALSGETASFLAGGEFPIPISQSLGAVTVEYKQYGVGLAFSPIVLDNGRISMRVRPEVSELSNEGSVRINGFQVPALTTRRTETTVELGSGQSMMISGLLRNVSNSTINRTPFLGSLPIIGALFRSNGFRRAETELVIVVTPYLVQPVSANRIALPTDGYRSSGDVENVLLGQGHAGRSGEARPMPAAGPAQTVRPGIVTGQAAPLPAPAAASAPVQTAANSAPARADSGARPGFDF